MDDKQLREQFDTGLKKIRHEIKSRLVPHGRRGMTRHGWSGAPDRERSLFVSRGVLGRVDGWWSGRVGRGGSLIFALFQPQFFADAGDGTSELFAPGFSSAADVLGYVGPLPPCGAQVGELAFVDREAVAEGGQQFAALDDSTKRALNEAEARLTTEVEKAAALVRDESARHEQERDAAFSRAAEELSIIWDSRMFKQTGRMSNTADNKEAAAMCWRW